MDKKIVVITILLCLIIPIIPNITLPAKAYDMGEYVYVGGGGVGNVAVKQYWASNLTLKAQTATYGQMIYDIVQDDTYIYAAGRVTDSPWHGTINKYWKSNLTLAATSASYGGGGMQKDILCLAIDDTYVYAAGATANYVSKYWKSNLTWVANTVSYGGWIWGICVDDTYIYAGGATTQRVRWYWKTNMTYKGQQVAEARAILGLSQDNYSSMGSVHYYVALNTIASGVGSIHQYGKGGGAASTPYYGSMNAVSSIDSTYFYCGGAGSTLYQFWKSNVSSGKPPRKSVSFGSQIEAIGEDGKYVYVGGDTTTFRKYDKATLTSAATGTYGTTIYAILVETTPFDDDVYVDDDAAPSWYDYSHVHTVEEGIDVVPDGRTIYVLPGYYIENQLEITKHCNLIGSSPDEVTIDADGSSYLMEVNSDYVNISGITFYNSFDGLLNLYVGQYCSVTNCYFDTSGNGCIGIGGEGAGFNTTISDCVITNVDFNPAIMCLGGEKITIRNTTITNVYGDGTAISLSYTDDVIMDGCNISDCDVAIRYSGVESQITNNVLYDCGYGIVLESEDATISNNNISDMTEDGLFIDYCTISRIENNIIHDCLGSGISTVDGVDAVYDNIFFHNEIYNNSNYGYYSGEDDYGTSNLWYDNSFHGNPINAYDVYSEDIWNVSKTLGTNIMGGPYLGGNYWSDYTGEDTSGDGLGDTWVPHSCGIYMVPGDYLPLMEWVEPHHHEPEPQPELPPSEPQGNETIIRVPQPELPKYAPPAFSVPEMYQLLHATNLSNSDAEVTVMVIDSGVLPITYNNIQLNKISAIKGISLSNQFDENGHGTWVNYAVAYMLQTKVRNAKQISYRVFGSDGICNSNEFVKALETAKQMHVDIVSISAGVLGTKDDAFVKACEDLRNNGIIVICAAGNFGPSPGSIASPGISDSVIAVSASDPIETGMYSTETHMRGVLDLRDDIICSWSSRGPIADVQKPDVTAPGESIMGPWLYDERTLSGTSMATPLVSGGIALVYANNKQEIDIVKALYFWDKSTIPQLFEDALKDSCFVKGNQNDWGSGIVQFDKVNSNVQAGLHSKMLIGFAGLFIIILIIAFFIYRSRHKSSGYKVPKWLKK